jgi:glycosyltransferase involved in cell wall biosynthesis
VRQTFSIITPTSNSAKTIEATLASVLSQDFESWEHVIVDNCSTDATLEIIQDSYLKAGKTSKLKIISEPDKGISDAFNKGIAAASGQLIHILNSDDQYFSVDTLSRVNRAFANSKAKLVHGSIVFDDPIYGSQIRRPLNCSVSRAMPFQHPAVFVDRSVYERFGCFNLSYRYAMDFEWACRLFASSGYSKIVIHELSVPPLSRMSGSGVSARNEKAALNESLRALRSNCHLTVIARFHLAARRFRLLIKDALPVSIAKLVVRLWRRFKWH